MLSKAEIQYLEGKKQFSKSYERKIKCLIRKKIKVLRTELPLLSQLFIESLELSVPARDSDKKAALANRTVKEDSNEENSSQSLHSSHATKFSNLDSDNLEIDAEKDVKGPNFAEYILSVKDKSTSATEFGNVPSDGATKNSNPYEIHDIELNPINISIVGTVEDETFNYSIKNTLLSRVGRVGFEPTTPAMSRRYLNQARPPALVL